MGKKRILSLSHGSIPGTQVVPPLRGKELEVPSCGYSHTGGQCRRWQHLPRAGIFYIFNQYNYIAPLPNRDGVIGAL